jgi:hypothetical protein
MKRLRDSYENMERAVANAYGWDELHFDHAFRETKQGLRFTISDSAHREVLLRLFSYHHHKKPTQEGEPKGTNSRRKAKAPSTVKASRVRRGSPNQQTLLDDEE